MNNDLKKLIAVCVLLCASFIAKAQTTQANSRYWEKSKQIDSLFERKSLKTIDSTTIALRRLKAIELYNEMLKINNRLLTVDMVSYFVLSISAADEQAFYKAAQMLILNSAKPIEDYLDLKSLCYPFHKGDSNNILDFNKSIAKIKKKQHKWIHEARQKLDWDWVVAIESINKSDYDFRGRIKKEWYLDTTTRWYAMSAIDSAHIELFCNNIQERGFPKMSRVGLSAAQIQAPIKHYVGLLSWDESVRQAYFIKKWEFLFPELHKAVQELEMDRGFYKHIYKLLLEYSNDDKRLAEFSSFLKKYEMK